MTFFQFIKSKLFWWQVLLSVGVSIVLVVLVMWGLNLYTRYSRVIIVPTLVGLTEDVIGESLDNVGLSYVVIDSLHVTGALPGVIVDQLPAAGKKVKKGRKIFVTINARTREMTLMPQLVDYSLRNAQVVLETAGLKLANVKYVPSEYDGLVLGQYIADKPVRQGSKIPKGTAITLAVGNGQAGKQVVVPDCVGLPYNDALSAIRSAGLTVGALLFDTTVGTELDTLQSMVYRQNPPADGSTEMSGASVNLWLTTDEEKLTEALASSVED